MESILITTRRRRIFLNDDERFPVTHILSTYVVTSIEVLDCGYFELYGDRIKNVQGNRGGLLLIGDHYGRVDEVPTMPLEVKKAVQQAQSELENTRTAPERS